jgi:cystathionine beta-synthase
MGKMFNDDWMRERGFLDEQISVGELISKKSQKDFVSIDATQSIKSALKLMKQKDISQIPVFEGAKLVGSITETGVLSALLENPLTNADLPVSTIMGATFPLVEESLPVSLLSQYIDKNTPAVLVQNKAGVYHILTQYDILHSLAD